MPQNTAPQPPLQATCGAGHPGAQHEGFYPLLNAPEISAGSVLRHKVLSGKEHVFDEMAQKLEHVTPKQRKAAWDILDADIKNLDS